MVPVSSKPVGKLFPITIASVLYSQVERRAGPPMQSLIH